MIATIAILSSICFGLIIGSFFNVLIWRIPRNESIVWPASHCPKCSSPLKPWHNIPVFSYLFLRGRCRFCNAPIAFIYPLVECATGCAALVIWLYLIRPHLILPPAALPGLGLQALFLLLTIPVSIIDIQHYIIPDRFSLSLLGLGVIVSFLPGYPTPLDTLYGILAGGGSLLLVGWIGTALLKKGDAMGGGDIKLMAAAGALWGPQTALTGIIFGALFGSIIGIALIVRKKLSSEHHIPFGPFLSIGIWVAVFFGNEIITIYMDWITALSGG